MRGDKIVFMAEVSSWKNIFHRSRRFLAKFWLEVNPQLRIVGITGSYGKTSTTVAITKVLSKKFPTVQTDFNLDTVYNLPITILRVKPWTEGLVLEMGVDHPKEMDFHLSLVQPQIGVVTGISPVHSDKEHLGSLEEIIKEKSKLLEALPEDGLAVLNYDDENVRKMAKITNARFIFYGKDKKNCQVWADKIKINLEGLTFNLHHKEKLLKINTNLIGSHHVQTCMAAYIVGNYFGVSDEQILVALDELKPLQGRLNLEKGPMGCLLINDSRRANPASTIAGLITLSDLPGGRKIAVLGEMGELGNFSEEGHRLVGKRLAGLKIDFLVAIGPLTKFIVDEARKKGFSPKNSFWVVNVVEASEVLRKIIKKNDLIYLKGSLLRHLERVILILEGKKVDCQEISCHQYNLCQTCPKLLNNIKSN